MSRLADLRQAELWQEYYVPDEFMSSERDYLVGGEVGRWLSWKHIRFELHVKPRTSLGIRLRKLFGNYDSNSLEDNYKIVSATNRKKVSITVQFYKEGDKIKSKYSLDNELEKV